MKKIAFSIFLFFCVHLMVYAQVEITVSGTILFQGTGAPVPDRPVLAFAGDSLNFTQGMGITDSNGAYSFTFTAPTGTTEVLVVTQLYCQVGGTGIFPVVNGLAVAHFVECDDPLPVDTTCWTYVDIQLVDSLTFAFDAPYFYGFEPVSATYVWSFGDSTTSTEAQPIHTYPGPGFYSVTVVVTGADGCIAIGYQAINTDFGGFPECSGLITYQQLADSIFAFTPVIYGYDQNPGDPEISYLWDFGDGTTSTESQPIHEYPSDGVYSVQMTATLPDGCVVHACDVIFGSGFPIDTFWYGCQAMFGVDVAYVDSSGTVNPLSVAFYDLSIGTPVSWHWDFGDGATGTTPYVTHTYNQSGLYVVTLSITTIDSCESQTSFVICVGNDCGLPEYDCQALFMPFPDSVFSNGNGIQFIDISYAPWGVTSWAWDFGDSTTSTEQHPYHEYAVAGIYTVTLTITGDSCSSVIAFEIDTENPWNFNQSPAQLGASPGSVSTFEKVVLNGLKCYPNPAQSNMIVAFNSPSATDLTLRVLDISGKAINSDTYQAASGLNQLKVEVGSLVPGIYLAELRSKDEVRMVKFVKQ